MRIAEEEAKEAAVAERIRKAEEEGKMLREAELARLKAEAEKRFLSALARLLVASSKDGS